MSASVITFDVTGDMPLMTHNEQLANPLCRYVRDMKKLNEAKKKKGADADTLLEQMAAVEWEGGLYYDPAKGPCVPATYFRAAIVEAARASKKGKDVQRAVFCIGDSLCPILYDGPRDLDGLRERLDFRDMRMVKVQQARVLRSRPIFRAWSVRGVRLMFNGAHMSKDALVEHIEAAGRIAGIGDARSLGYGRFRLDEYKVSSLT